MLNPRAQQITKQHNTVCFFSCVVDCLLESPSSAWKPCFFSGGLFLCFSKFSFTFGAVGDEDSDQYDDGGVTGVGEENDDVEANEEDDVDAVSSNKAFFSISLRQRRGRSALDIM